MIQTETNLKDLAELQRDSLLTVRDVRNILSLSASAVVNLIKDGKLEAYDLFDDTTGGIGNVNPRSNGIRISPESLQRFIGSKILT